MGALIYPNTENDGEGAGNHTQRATRVPRLKERLHLDMIFLET
jgi:hypothetical protein